MRIALAAVVCGVAVAACGSSSGPSTSAASKSDAGLQFSHCMRSHGLSNFPDPTSGGQIQIGGTGLSPFSHAFQAAQNACQHLLPNKGQPLRMTAADRRAAIRFSECMRTHGEPNFPDPSDAHPSGANMVLSLRGMTFAIGSGLDPRSPAFRQAAESCGIKLPTGPPRAIR